MHLEVIDRERERESRETKEGILRRHYERERGR